MEEATYLHCGDYDPVGVQEYLRLQKACPGCTSLYTTYDLRKAAARPEGGGGTSFTPFFDAIAKDRRRSVGRHVAVYFTGLYGDFPEPRDHPTLWVVPPGGAPSEEVPFGEVVRLREANG